MSLCKSILTYPLLQMYSPFWRKTSSNRFRDFFSALYLSILIITITLVELDMHIQKWRGSYIIARPASEAFALPCKSERATQTPTPICICSLNAIPAKYNIGT